MEDSSARRARVYTLGGQIKIRAAMGRGRVERKDGSERA
jgi:hypothetical protein